MLQESKKNSISMMEKNKEGSNEGKLRRIWLDTINELRFYQIVYFF